MANAIADLAQLQVQFAQSLAPRQAIYDILGNTITGVAPGTVRVGAAQAGGIAQTLSANSTSVSATDFGTIEASVSTSHKVIKHSMPKFAYQGSASAKGLLDILAKDAASQLDLEFTSGLEGLFSLNHPRAGAGKFQTGVKRYIDSGLAYLQTEVGAGTQSNLLTSALDEASLQAAIKTLQSWKSDRGVVQMAGRGNCVLIVGSENAAAAHELTKSMLSGADNADNYVRGIVSDVISVPFVTDDSDWFLIDKDNCPVGMVVANPPTLDVRESDDGQFLHFIVSWDSAFAYSPNELGIVGSNVA